MLFSRSQIAGLQAISAICFGLMWPLQVPLRAGPCCSSALFAQHMGPAHKLRDGHLCPKCFCLLATNHKMHLPRCRGGRCQQRQQQQASYEEGGGQQHMLCQPAPVQTVCCVCRNCREHHLQTQQLGLDRTAPLMPADGLHTQKPKQFDRLLRPTTGTQWLPSQPRSTPR